MSNSKFSISQFWIIGIILLASLLWLWQDILAPFITGILVAYLLNPLLSKFAYFRQNRGIGAFVFLMIFATLVALFLVFVVPYVVVQIYTYLSGLGEYIAHVKEDLQVYITRFLAFIPQTQQKEILAFVSEHMGTILVWIAQFFERLLTGSMSIISTLSFMIVTPLVAFYFLRDLDLITKNTLGYIPKKNYEAVVHLCHQMNQVVHSFLRGQFIVALILGVFYSISLSLVQLNFGLLIGFIAGLFTIIPYLGPFTGVAVSLMVAFFQFDGWNELLAIVGIFSVGQFVESYILTPKLVGESVGLHPVWLIFSLMAGHNLLGFTGVLLAVPTAAVIGVMVRFLLEKYKSSSYYLQGI